ncbi:hypothetical protein SAMN05216232_0369 [Virgibacillus subterraneus]|uniref:ATP-binding protein n=1 Tax=Virgibacillus subterraneus TaxID=621109 RepID=A0A1H8ZBQ1_9BACI|nr:hypothetical protein [Virgibacillus subterraneus]SEP61826.1 hypothetical protein SAMN05216232_0369 [Virgibacillus subterraneus]
MITSKSKFKASVNIKLDLGSDWIQERYIPTPTHLESLTGVLQGFLPGGNKSHILVGSYGSGKSMIGALIANIASKNVDSGVLDQLIDKFDKVNTDEKTIIELINTMKQTNKVYIPVVINGKQDKLREVVISSIHNSLKRFNLDFTIPSFVEEIKSIINLWNTQYLETYNQFNRILEKENWNVKSFIKDIEAYDVSAIKWFQNIYPVLTAGAELSLSYDHDITDDLSYILNELDKNGLGIFLVYDEFGRFLQSIDKYETVEAMQDIQDIAELADHHECENFNVLLITHRNLKQYFLSYGEELQNEFNRIQGRFRMYNTYSDPATFIRLASEVTSEYRVNHSEKYNFENEIIKYDLFPELNGREKKSIIVDNSFPIHPVTMFTLPHLANAVAQNERTLFTFLESNEEGGLKRYFENKNTWYYVDILFKYFEPALQEFTNDSLIGKSYLKYLRVQKKINKSKTSELELQLLRLFTIWDIANLSNKQKLSKDFISFSLGWDIQRVKEIVSILESKKIIRYRLFDNNWEIFEGSSIDINKKIEEILKLGISQQRRVEILSEVLESKFAYPKRYNDEKNMIRFATIHPVYASDLTLEKASDYLDGDMAILYIIPDLEVEGINEKVNKISIENNRLIFALPKKSLGDIDGYLSKVAAIDQLLEDKYFLNEDNIIEEELLKIKENFTFVIRELMEPIIEFKNSYWIHTGIDLKVKSKISLSKKLSDIIKKIYSKTPLINNEAFNRRNISKQQLNAAKEVVDSIINKSDYNAKFKGPAKLIFASVVKNNRINERKESKEIKELRKKLNQVIKMGQGDFVNLINVFKQEPFGIREPNIPILLTSILKNDWKYIMFYHKDGSYIYDINGDILYDRMLDRPENYTFSYQVVDENYKVIIDIIDNCFAEFSEESDESYHPTVRISRMLLKWFRELPKITQKTDKLSREAVMFKQLTKKGEFEPDVALQELNDLNINLELIKRIKSECENYSDKHMESIENKIYSLTKTSSFEELSAHVKSQKEIIKVDNRFYKVVSRSNEGNWINNLAKELVGVDRSEWSDATDEVFSKTIKSLIEFDQTSLLEQEYYQVKDENKTMAISKTELSSKGKIIYSNVKTDLELMSRKLPKEEITALLYKLLVDYYDENK